MIGSLVLLNSFRLIIDSISKVGTKIITRYLDEKMNFLNKKNFLIKFKILEMDGKPWLPSKMRDDVSSYWS